jgi:AcrR family transcriptional regulator
LPPELVERNQRERLIAAMAELCGEVGYAESSVAEIAKRAGVSTASFYRQFEDKRECMLVSFEELFGRLLAAIEAACASAGGREEKLGAAVELVASALAADRPSACLLSVEILALGSAGALAQHGAIDRLASLLPTPVDAKGRDPAEVAWASVAAATSRAARRVAEGGSPTAQELMRLLV